jgi:hypothetical protein
VSYSETHFVRQYEPGSQARVELVNGQIVDGDPLTDFRVIGSRVAALFTDGKLVIDNYGLRVEPAG